MSQELRPFGDYGFTSATSAGNVVPAQFVRFWEIGDYAELMRHLQSFLDTVLETNQIPFDIRHQWGRQQAVRNPMGVSGYRSLSGFLPLCGQWMDLYWPGYSYSADLQLFFDCFRQHAVAQAFGYGSPAGIYDKAYAASLYNDFVGYLRMESVLRGVRKKLADRRANIHEQEKAIRQYLGALLGQYRWLVPVRVDFYYAEYAADDGYAMTRTGWVVADNGIWTAVQSNAPIGHGRPEARARIDAAVAMGDRDRFFENRRGADRALFDRMAGYICKMEQGGRHKANHFHCLFLFDAARLSQKEVDELKYGIEDRWRRVTQGQGLMYDCHDRPDRGELRARGHWAIDPVDCANRVHVATLVNYLVGYFTKDDDQMIRIKPTAKARTLTMGR